MLDYSGNPKSDHLKTGHFKGWFSNSKKSDFPMSGFWNDLAKTVKYKEKICLFIKQSKLNEPFEIWMCPDFRSPLYLGFLF